MKTATAGYAAKTAALWKAPAYMLRMYRVTGGMPSGTEVAFARDFVSATLQAQTGTKLVCLDAPAGNVQTIFPEQGQSTSGSFRFILYDRDGEITVQLGHATDKLTLGTRVQLYCGYADLDEAEFLAFSKMEVTDIRLLPDLRTFEVVVSDVQRFLRGGIFLSATPGSPIVRTANPVTMALQILLTGDSVGGNHPTYDLGDDSGLDLPQALVDVAGLEALRGAEFPADSYSWTIKAAEDGKQFLEHEIWQTLNCVPVVTGEGKYSARRLLPAGTPVRAIGVDEVIQIVGWRLATDRVINVLDFRYDYDLDANPDAFSKRRIYTADDSIERYGRRPALVIESRGIKSASGGDAIADARAQRVFDRWADPPAQLDLDLFYSAHLVEIGDQVAVTLPEVPDPRTGARGIDGEIFEVLDVRPMFSPLDPAGVRVSLLWIGALPDIAAPAKTTQTMTGDVVSIQVGATAEDVEILDTETELVSAEITLPSARPVNIWAKVDLDGEYTVDGWADVELRLYRDTTLLDTSQHRMTGTDADDTGDTGGVSLAFETPAAGTYTYHLEGIKTAESNVVSVTALHIQINVMAAA